VQNIPGRIDSKFRFVLLSAARAEQMMEGAPPKVESADKKHTRVAMNEIIGEAVEWDYGPPEVAEPATEEETEAEDEG
jgi:DNA-directed RNA polymerase omega subunit